ncbi:uncharacterized protein LOC135153868 [Lytechinus pictus]|uniref:uncharacterized protein LOC135153868 n=1 Tax=Lytechinus pictus TaxID=7653 RepID=UPI0030B9BD04
MRVLVSCWIMLAMSRMAYAVDLLMTPPLVHVYQGQTFRVTCVVTGEYQARYHSIHLLHHPKNGRETYVTNDETVARTLDPNRQIRYSIHKKTSGSGQNQRWEFILTVVKAAKADIGRFQCLRIERAPRSTQHSSTFTRVYVNDVIPASPVAPQCALSPANPLPGQRTTFSCFSIGEAPKLTLNWSRGKRRLPSKSSNSTGRFNVVTYQHVISEWDNNATFTCTATGLALSYETRTCSVVPFVINTNVTVTSTQRVKEKEPAEFICLAVSVPATSKYTWVITQGSNKEVVDRSSGRYVIEQGGALLRINSVTLKDNNSSVECIASNGMNMEGTSTGTLFTEPATTSPHPRGDGIGTRHGHGGKGDGNFVFYGDGGDPGRTLLPFSPENGRHEIDKNGFGGKRPNVPVFVGCTTGFVIFMTLIVLLLAMVMRKRTKRQKAVIKSDAKRRPISIISLTTAFDVEKPDVALVEAKTTPQSQTVLKSTSYRKSLHNLPSSSSRKSGTNQDISRQHLADKLSASLRSKSYASLMETPIPTQQTLQPDDATDDDCVSRVSTEDSAYDDLTCSLGSVSALGSRSNSNATSDTQSCYGSVGSLLSTVRYSRGKDTIEVMKKRSLHYAEIDWSGRTPPSGKIVDSDEKTLYAQIRK